MVALGICFLGFCGMCNFPRRGGGGSKGHEISKCANLANMWGQIHVQPTIYVSCLTQAKN